MPKTFPVSKSQCSQCKGQCCKGMPGICEPKDIARIFPAKTLKESVLKALRTHDFSIDWWEGDKPLYYVRPSTVEGRGKIWDSSWGGQCVFLKSNGCGLGENRPLECRMLRPRKTSAGDCNYDLRFPAKKVFGRLWSRYIDLGNFEYTS